MRTIRALLTRQRPDSPPRANQTRIAVLGHDLYGIQPEPGTMAALTIALRQAGTCIKHTPVQRLGGHPRGAVCAGCGRTLILNDDGDWEIA